MTNAKDDKVTDAKANLHLDSRGFSLSSFQGLGVSGYNPDMSWITAHSSDWLHIYGDSPSTSVLFMVRKTNVI